MVHSKQAGSVVSFVIIGGVLVLAVAGALYWAGQQHSNDDVVKTPEVTLPALTDDQASENTKKDEDTTDKEPSPDTQSPSDEKPKPDVSDTDTTKGKSSDDSQVTELSHTGPADSFVGIFATGILTGSVVAFAQSRRRDTTL